MLVAPFPMALSTTETRVKIVSMAPPRSKPPFSTEAALEVFCRALEERDADAGPNTPHNMRQHLALGRRWR